VVAGLRSELGSSDFDKSAAAIVLIADVADYCVQTEAATFGGGAAPECLAPDSPFRIDPEPTSGEVIIRARLERPLEKTTTQGLKEMR
jgi:hypothetical protein